MKANERRMISMELHHSNLVSTQMPLVEILSEEAEVVADLVDSRISALLSVERVEGQAMPVTCSSNFSERSVGEVAVVEVRSEEWEVVQGPGHPLVARTLRLSSTSRLWTPAPGQRRRYPLLLSSNVRLVLEVASRPVPSGTPALLAGELDNRLSAYKAC